MRLTLRALLNWINQNLSPEDTKLIAQKVAGSEFATNLKNQLLEVVKIQRLQAPPVLDGTPLGNPNTVAEYLDNVMPPEQTPDFEKFCLHSDVVLAEVASCHRILSLVLAKPIEVTPTIRAKMGSLFSLYYGMPDPLQLDTGTDLEQLSTDESSFTEVSPQEISSKPASAVWKYVMGAVGMVLLVLCGWFMGRSTAPVAVPLPQPSSESTVEKDVAQKPAVENPVNEVPAVEKSTEAVSEEKVMEPKEGPKEEPKLSEPIAEEAPEPAVESEEMDDNPEAEEAPEEATDAELDAELDAEVAASEESEEEPAAVDEVSRQVVGSVRSAPEQILLSQSDSKEWNPLKQQVLSNTSYVSLETFQPSLSILYDELVLQLKGASQVRLGTMGKTLPVILEYGQFVLQTGNEKDMGRRISVQLTGLGNTQLTLSSGTKLGVSLFLPRDGGEDPATSPVVQADLYLISGEIQVQNDVAQTSYQAEDPMVIHLDSVKKLSSRGEPLEGMPTWIDNSPALAADRKNGEKMVAFLKKEMENQSFAVCLHALTEDKKSSREVQLLSKRSLCQLLDSQAIDEFVTAYGAKTTSKAEKKECREELQTLIYRSSFHAKQVRKLMDDDSLYQSLIGNREP